MFWDKTEPFSEKFTAGKGRLSAKVLIKTVNFILIQSTVCEVPDE